MAADIDALIAELRAGLDAEMDWRKSQADFGQLARFIHAASPQNIRALLDYIERLESERDDSEERAGSYANENQTLYDKFRAVEVDDETKRREGKLHE